MKNITDTVNDVCMLLRYQMGYNYVGAVSRIVGYCLYGTLLLRPCWTACPVQIRAHHHIDVCTDINKYYERYFLTWIQPKRLFDTTCMYDVWSLNYCIVPRSL